MGFGEEISREIWLPAVAVRGTRAQNDLWFPLRRR